MRQRCETRAGFGIVHRISRFNEFFSIRREKLHECGGIVVLSIFHQRFGGFLSRRERLGVLGGERGR